MSEKSSSSSSGIGFFGLLTIVFITLKLCNVITWSWWWVLAPLWGVVVLFVAIGLIVVVVMCTPAFMVLAYSLVLWAIQSIREKTERKKT